MTMTDGLYSRVPLSFAEERITAALGDWEATPFESIETFKPGIYRYKDADGMHYKVRGFLTPTDHNKRRLFRQITLALHRNKGGKFPAKAFLTRNLSLEGWKREPWVRQFYIDKKDIESELKAKREQRADSGWLIPDGSLNAFFAPKRSHELNNSVGYALAFEVDAGPADDDEELAELYRQDYDALIGIEEYYDMN